MFTLLNTILLIVILVKLRSITKDIAEIDI